MLRDTTRAQPSLPVRIKRAAAEMRSAPFTHYICVCFYDYLYVYLAWTCMNARHPLRIQMHITTAPVPRPWATLGALVGDIHARTRHTHTHTHTHKRTLVLEVESLGGRPDPFLRGCMMMGSDAVSDIENLCLDSRTLTHTHGK